MAADSFLDIFQIRAHFSLNIMHHSTLKHFLSNYLILEIFSQIYRNSQRTSRYWVIIVKIWPLVKFLDLFYIRARFYSNTMPNSTFKYVWLKFGLMETHTATGSRYTECTVPSKNTMEHKGTLISPYEGHCNIVLCILLFLQLSLPFLSRHELNLYEPIHDGLWTYYRAFIQSLAYLSILEGINDMFHFITLNLSIQVYHITFWTTE